MTPTDLKRIREGMGWTQTEAAERVGVKMNSWARWERGEIAIHPARLDALQRLLRQAERRLERGVHSGE